MPENRPLQEQDTANRVDDWFMLAVGMEPTEREAFLAEKYKVCPEDVDEVKKLLSGYHDFDELVEGQASNSRESIGQSLFPPTPSGEPEQVGSYRIIRKIGEGGMGTIYLARQPNPEREVALKLIPGHKVSERLRHRFVAECQALAMMTHHNIAHIYEAGTTPEGDIFFAMEHIEGMPLTRFAGNLPLRARLDLFLQVCAGVQHAHQRAIIHRDLKPANILVTMKDGDPQVKIIDFGLAHGTDEAQANSVPTLSGTPAYMSPELLTGEVGRGDTRWDIFSLGVLFYELLAGAHPLDLEPLNNLKLKEALDRLATDPRPTPEQRRQMQQSLGEQAYDQKIPADLECIAMKAMAPDINERYPSVNAIREDIDRYFQLKPVEARAGGLLYQLSRFVRRHQVILGTAALTFLSLVAGLVLAVTSWVSAEQARKDAETTLNFLQDVLASPNPRSKGREVKMVDVLEQAESRLDSNPTVNPLLDLEVRLTLARTWFGLGQYYEAEQLLKQILQRARGSFADNDPNILSVRFELAQTTRRKGMFDEAAVMFKHVHAQQVEVLGESHPQTLRSLAGLAMSERQRKNYPEARSLFLSALAGQRAQLGPNHPDVMISLVGLANTYFFLGKLEEAQRHYEEALQRQAARFGKDHPEALATRHALANCLDAAKQFTQAEQLFRETLADRERVLGPDHSETLKTAYALARCRERQGRREEAEQGYLHVMMSRRDLAGHNHADTQRAVYALARIWGRQNRLEDAAGLLEESLGMITDLTDTQAMKMLIFLGGVYDVKKDYPKSMQTLEKALALTLEKHGELNPQTTRIRAMLAAVYRKQGDNERALETYCAGLDAAHQQFPGNRILQNLLRGSRELEAAL